jgi:DNA polymerase III subunit alpha
MMAGEGGGRGRVSVVVPLQSQHGALREVEIALPGSFKVTPRLTEAVAAIPGVLEAQEI